MLQAVTEKEILERLRHDNPWWADSEKWPIDIGAFPKRDYFDAFIQFVKARSPKRAVILLGPRRVGKTVMIYQAIKKLLEDKEAGKSLLYLSLETPLYTGQPLERMLRLFLATVELPADARVTIFFDEIQYLRDWETHLKSLVDAYPNAKFVASGSSAAALRLKSRESGAGRFTEFSLPPLTFCEYLRFTKLEGDLIETKKAGREVSTTAKDIGKLNAVFIDYLNIGGYPEAVFDDRIRANTARFIASDIIDKVLLRDLPSLYGIQDIQELNRLFMTLAYNSGNEISLDNLSNDSGVAKNTIKRYLEYLEAAFLLRRVYRVDHTARRFQRETTFKVYLANPTMRAALFGPVNDADAAMGPLTETAIFSQWFHRTTSVEHLHYARWKSGEVDIVSCERETQKPGWAMEVKWSDHAVSHSEDIKGLIEFCKRHELLDTVLVTTKTFEGTKVFGDVTIKFRPSSLHAYILGRNTARNAANELLQRELRPEKEAGVPGS